MKSLTERLSSLKGKFLIYASRRPLCTTIDLLPTELILYIASYLPFPSAAALALCSHDFFGILAKPYITSLFVPTTDLEDMLITDIKAQDRVLLLQTISGDSLNTFVCYRCLRIHNVLKKGEHFLTTKSRFKRVTHGHCVLSNASKSDNLGLCHLEVAKNFYQKDLKLDAIRYLELASLARPELSVFAVRVPGFKFWEAFFIGDRIYSRAQYWLNLPEDDRFSMAKRKLFITVCEHTNSQNDEEDMLGDCISQVIERAGNRGDISQYLRCERCPLEICVDLGRVDGFPNRQFLVITKWQYTEASASLIPKPQDFVAALDESTVNSSWSAPTIALWREFPITRRFEMHTETPFEEICTVEQAWKIMEESSGQEMHWKLGLQRLGGY